MPLKVKTWATITPAIIGLVGVLVGAIITTGANYLLAVRQETADAAKTKLARANELKTAARLIANEFVLAHSAAKNLVEQKRLMPEQIECTLDAWQRYKGVVALELPYTDWTAAYVAALAVEHLSLTRPTPLLTELVANDPLAESGKRIVRDIDAGLKALAPYLIDNPPLKSN